MNPELPPEELDESDPGLDIDLLRRRREWVLTLAAVTLIVVAALGVAYQMLRPERLDRRTLLAAAQQTVKETMGGGYVYVFSGLAEASVEQQTDERYKVRGEVLALTPQGQSTHYWYDCLLARQSDGGWRPAQLTLLPQ